jgi:2-polyprenyl-6-methoxyphenol hydroxylase-like FAD-dependent oxidoreductase
MRQIGEHAVVLGAGMAGLLAARVLSEAYRRVTIIERDPLPRSAEPARSAEPRRGVPQGRHAHLLIPGGAQVVNQLFKGLFDDLSAAGVPVIRDFAEFRFSPGGGHPLRLRGPTDDPFISQASRPCLEQHLRARVRALPTVELIDRCDVVDLTTVADRSRVTGVRVSRPAVGDGAETLDADLVVDATGRGSRAPAWLATLGYGQPRQEQHTIGLKYVTRHLRLRPEALGAKVVGIGALPRRPTGLVLFAQEDDRWILTVFGYEGHHPPHDPDGLLDTVEATAPADVFTAIRDAEPVGEITTYRFPANLRRRYDRLRRFPAGLLVIGDAICSTNPAYALGMSTAALQAAALRDMLADGDRDLARRFFRAAAEPTNRAWQAVVSGDSAMPQVKDPRPLPARVIDRYAARVLRAAERDPVVAMRFFRVASLQDPPTRLFRPATALRVLRQNLRRAQAPAGDAVTAGMGMPRPR